MLLPSTLSSLAIVSKVKNFLLLMQILGEAEMEQNVSSIEHGGLYCAVVRVAFYFVREKIHNTSTKWFVCF